jgi:hypothetical protein
MRWIARPLSRRVCCCRGMRVGCGCNTAHFPQADQRYSACSGSSPGIAASCERGRGHRIRLRGKLRTPGSHHRRNLVRRGRCCARVSSSTSAMVVSAITHILSSGSRPFSDSPLSGDGKHHESSMCLAHTDRSARAATIAAPGVAASSCPKRTGLSTIRRAPGTDRTKNSLFANQTVLLSGCGKRTGFYCVVPV